MNTYEIFTAHGGDDIVQAEYFEVVNDSVSFFRDNELIAYFKSVYQVKKINVNVGFHTHTISWEDMRG